MDFPHKTTHATGVVFLQTLEASLGLKKKKLFSLVTIREPVQRKLLKAKQNFLVSFESLESASTRKDDERIAKLESKDK